MTDCIVLGAGSAGAAAALFAARAGLRVTLVDKRERPRVGASWINGVERRLFGDLGLGEPPDPVIFYGGHRFVLASPDGSARQVVDSPPSYEVDMHALTSWLLDLAVEAGAQLRFGSEAEVDEWDGHCREVRFGGERHRARVVVDASGFMGRAVRALRADLDVCSAFQAVHEVHDVAAAERWLDAEGLLAGDTFSRTGVEGGYSVLNVMVLPADRQVAILTGAMARPGLRSGSRIASDFIESTPWVGRRLLGGGGLIPLRPLTHSFVAPGLVRIGNNVGQVFSSHGSGVAPGMRAAHAAARAIESALRGGAATLEALWPFNVAYQTGVGAVCAMYQPFRYLSSSLSPEQSRSLIACGAIHPDSISRALDQVPYRLGWSDVARLAPHTRALAPLLPSLGWAGALGHAMRFHFQSFPKTPDPAALADWERRAERLWKQASRLATPNLPPSGPVPEAVVSPAA
jgi:flavin-dependent dehydrogenase